jgi:hypothetical protein
MCSHLHTDTHTHRCAALLHRLPVPPSLNSLSPLQVPPCSPTANTEMVSQKTLSTLHACLSSCLLCLLSGMFFPQVSRWGWTWWLICHSNYSEGLESGRIVVWGQPRPKKKKIRKSLSRSISHPWWHETVAPTMWNYCSLRLPHAKCDTLPEKITKKWARAHLANGRAWVQTPLPPGNEVNQMCRGFVPSSPSATCSNASVYFPLPNSPPGLLHHT